MLQTYAYITKYLWAFWGNLVDSLAEYGNIAKVHNFISDFPDTSDLCSDLRNKIWLSLHLRNDFRKSNQVSKAKLTLVRFDSQINSSHLLDRYKSLARCRLDESWASYLGWPENLTILICPFNKEYFVDIRSIEKSKCINLTIPSSPDVDIYQQEISVVGFEPLERISTEIPKVLYRVSQYAYVLEKIKAICRIMNPYYTFHDYFYNVITKEHWIQWYLY